MSNLRSPLWRTSYQRSFLFVFQTRHSPVVHVGQRAKLVTHKVGKGGLKFINEKKNLLQRLAYTHGWKNEIWLKLLGKHFISYGHICTLFWSAQPNISMYAQSWYYVQWFILVKNLADLKLWTEFYLLKLMDVMVNTKQNMMKIW